MAYSRTTWENSPSEATPISADNLNNIEQGILDVESDFNALAGTVGVAMGTAGTAVNTTATQGSVVAIAGSVTAINSSLGSVAGSVTAINSSLGSVAGTVSMGGLVFTNEAARDAAITSPVEGMRVYLTAPTVPAATGSVTSIPTGITTVYNGSVWVCITEVGSASSTNTNMNVTTSYDAPWTSGSGDTTNNFVTLTTGTTALVQVSFTLDNAGGSGWIAAGVNVSGDTTQAASDNRCVAAPFFLNDPPQGFFSGVSGTILLAGLTAGTNTFTLNVKGNPTYTVRSLYRLISVRGIS